MRDLVMYPKCGGHFALQMMTLAAILGHSLADHCPSPQYLELGSSGLVQCHFDRGRDVAWYSRTDYEEYKLIAVDEDYQNGTYDIHPDGSLGIRNVSLDHDGYFRVIYSGGAPSRNVTEDVEVVVTVTPSPAYLLVDGCDRTSYCSLARDRVDSITCSVRGIRPAPGLEWGILHGTDGEDVTFTEREIITTREDGTYDVSSIATFQIHSHRLRKITVQCRASGDLAGHFHLSSTLDLVFPQEQRQWRYYLMALLIIPVLAGVIVLKKGAFPERLKMFFKRKEQQQELPDAESAVYAPLVPMGRLAVSDGEMLTNFSEQLRPTYRRWLEQPQQSSSKAALETSDTAERTFVCSCLEVFDDVRPRNGWRKLNSYHEILDNSSNRIIIEGKPGYGKSVMIERAALDWCDGNPQSAFGESKLFILLRMRYVEKTMSFFEAVLKTLLPNDTNFTTGNIRNVLSNCDSVVIALDDFHEHFETEIHDDFANIINGEMLQDATAITLTRPFCVPTDHAASTTFIRLTDLDPQAQDLYISNVLEDYPEHSRVELARDFRSEEVFSQLSQNPLFLSTGILSYLKLIADDDGSIGQSKAHSSTTLFKTFMANLEKKLVDGGHNHLDVQVQLKLGKVVLKSITQEKESVWPREGIIDKIGNRGYKKLVHLGILLEHREEEPSCLSTNLKPGMCVRFSYTIFCEWFASRYLARLLEAPSFFGKNEEYLKKLDPFDFDFLYRFTCGLSQEAAGTVLKYVKCIHNSDMFAVLCSMEKTDEIGDELDSIIERLGGVFELKPGNKLEQYSTILLLEMAAKVKTIINSVLVERCYTLVGTDNQRLSVGPDERLFIPPIHTMKRLVICDPGRSMSTTETLRILAYMSHCENIEKLRLVNTFHPFISFSLEDESLLMSLSMNEKVLLPGNIDESVLQKIKESNCIVEWSPMHEVSTYILDLVSGKWKTHPENMIHRSRPCLNDDDDDTLEELTIEEHARMFTKYNEFWLHEEQSQHETERLVIAV